MTQPHEHYYVPAQSKWPIIATLGMGTSVYGLATWFNDMSAQRADSNGPLIFSVGGLFLAYMLFGWFGAVIKESRAGLYSAQMDRSFRWGMSWFIFSEVMFFAAFFGALFYVRTFAGPWLGGEGAKGVTNMLWPNFEYVWPLLQNPDSGLFPPPREVIDPWHLPLLNTVLLAISLGPILLASAMYKWQFWLPVSRNYHGELIGNGQSRSELGVAAAETRWQLLVTAPVRCQRDCQQLLYLARQIQIGLGREAARASHALASAEPLAPGLHSRLQKEYPQLVRLALDRQQHDRLRHGDPAAQLWIIDPHGNLVLRYDVSADGKQILNDLRLLLKLSNIG